MDQARRGCFTQGRWPLTDPSRTLPRKEPPASCSPRARHPPRPGPGGPSSGVSFEQAPPSPHFSGLLDSHLCYTSLVQNCDSLLFPNKPTLAGGVSDLFKKATAPSGTRSQANEANEGSRQTRAPANSPALLAPPGPRSLLRDLPRGGPSRGPRPQEPSPLLHLQTVHTGLQGDAAGSHGRQRPVERREQGCLHGLPTWVTMFTPCSRADV